MTERAGAEQIAAWLRRCAAMIEDAQHELNRLDAVAGDGDHGATMVMAFRAVLGHLDDSPEATPGALLREAGANFASVGGSAGPLWGTALLRAGHAFGTASTIDARTVAVAAEAASQGMQERGRVAPGAKTVVDAMDPAARALRARAESGGSLHECLADAASAADEGCEATRSMVATRGRARRLADRSIGHTDPGATSCALIWHAAVCPTRARQPE